MTVPGGLGLGWNDRKFFNGYPFALSFSIDKSSAIMFVFPESNDGKFCVFSIDFLLDRKGFRSGNIKGLHDRIKVLV